MVMEKRCLSLVPSRGLVDHTAQCVRKVTRVPISSQICHDKLLEQPRRITCHSGSTSGVLVTTCSKMSLSWLDEMFSVKRAFACRSCTRSLQLIFVGVGNVATYTVNVHLGHNRKAMCRDRSMGTFDKEDAVVHDLECDCARFNGLWPL